MKSTASEPGLRNVWRHKRVFSFKKFSPSQETIVSCPSIADEGAFAWYWGCFPWKVEEIEKKKKNWTTQQIPWPIEDNGYWASCILERISQHRILKTLDQSGRAKKHPGNKLALSWNNSTPADRCYEASALITNPRWKKLISEHSS